MESILSVLTQDTLFLGRQAIMTVTSDDSRKKKSESTLSFYSALEKTRTLPDSALLSKSNNKEYLGVVHMQRQGFRVSFMTPRQASGAYNQPGVAGLMSSFFLE